MKVTFDRSALLFMLEALGYATDKEGYIVVVKTGERFLATDGKPIKPTQVATFTKNKIFRSDFSSLLQLSDRLK